MVFVVSLSNKFSAGRYILVVILCRRTVFYGTGKRDDVICILINGATSCTYTSYIFVWTSTRWTGKFARNCFWRLVTTSHPSNYISVEFKVCHKNGRTLLDCIVDRIICRYGIIDAHIFVYICHDLVRCCRTEYIREQSRCQLLSTID